MRSGRRSASTSWRGVVAKRRSGRYVSGERGWVKTKNRDYWRYEMAREGAFSVRRKRQPDQVESFGRNSGPTAWLSRRREKKMISTQAEERRSGDEV